MSGTLVEITHIKSGRAGAHLGDERRRVGERRRVDFVDHDLKPGLFESAVAHRLHEAYRRGRIVLNHSRRGWLLTGHFGGEIHDGRQGEFGLTAPGRRGLENELEAAVGDQVRIGQRQHGSSARSVTSVVASVKELR